MESIPDGIDSAVASRYQEFVSKCVERPSFDQIKTAYIAYDRLQNSIPISEYLFSWMPFTVAREFSGKVHAVWERFYTTCLNSIRNRGPASSIALAIRELEYMSTRFPDRDTLLLDLGDRYAQILAKEKAEKCYQRAFYLNPTVELAQKLEGFYRFQGDFKKANEMYGRIKGLWGRTVSEEVQLRQVVIDAAHDDWDAAFDRVTTKARKEGLSLDLVLRYADVILSLSDKSETMSRHIYLGFPETAEYRLQLLKNSSPDEKSEAILDLVDYLCRRSTHSDLLISKLCDDEGVCKGITLKSFFMKTEQWANWAQITLDKIERERERLCSLLQEKGFSCDEERLEMTSRVRGLHLFLQGGIQEFPVGLISYLSRYKKWLDPGKENLLREQGEFPDQHYQRFTSLEERARNVLSSLLLTGENELATLLGARVSRVESERESVDPPDRSFAMQNLFNYITLEVVPLERRDNVTEYLKENGIELDDILNCPFLDYVEQEEISGDYARITAFRVKNQLKEIEDLRKFVYNRRR